MKRIVLLTALAFACSGRPPVVDDTPALSSAPPKAPTPASAAAFDPGERPALKAAPAFEPPVPQVLEIPGLPRVWLLERHTLPLVSVQIVVEAGSADDPAGKAGLAALTAEMMEQGAGRYGALEISRLFDQLGAQVAVEAGVDHSALTLTVLGSNLKRALELAGDVVARPRFEKAEWDRSKALWLDQLRQRPFEPTDVASVVARAVFHGSAHPYGHPVDGHVDTVKTLNLADVKAFHQGHWRPDRATMVVVGDVTPETLKTVFAPAFQGWVAPKKVAPPPRASGGQPQGPWPRTVLVDRPDAPQTVFTFIAPGPTAADASQVALQLANIPLGGSFTSRLNANLREDKGYTYGVRSSVAEDRLAGRWTIRTSVETTVTAPALKEILKEIKGIQEGGLTGEELRKARASAQGDLVSAYESLEPIAERLGALVGNALPATFDLDQARARQKLADADILAAARAMSLGGATIIAVGQGKVVREAFEAAGLPPPEVRDADGRPVKVAK